VLKAQSIRASGKSNARPRGNIVGQSQSRVLKAHPIDFAEKPYLFSLWDVPSAHDLSILSMKTQRVVLRPRVGLVWVVPLAHEESAFVLIIQLRILG